MALFSRAYDAGGTKLEEATIQSGYEIVELSTMPAYTTKTWSIPSSSELRRIGANTASDRGEKRGQSQAYYIGPYLRIIKTSLGLFDLRLAMKW